MRWDQSPDREKYKELVDFIKCQIDEVVKAYKAGRPVEFETFGPYICDYNLNRGLIKDDVLLNEDKIGLAIGRVLKKYFPLARVVSLYDDYNTAMPDSEKDGAPTVKGGPYPLVKVSDEARKTFESEIVRLLKSNRVIDTESQEGQDYLLISEGSKVQDAEELVRRLDALGKIKREGKNNNTIIFVNEDAENPNYKEIVLCGENGHWKCETLDASTFLKPENLEITHLVVLPKQFREQQDKVWEILRVLGIRPTHYHNIFYDKTFDPEITAEFVDDQISQAIKTYEIK